MESADDFQLDLFGLDRIRLGEGYAALELLQLDRAASIFNGLTLENPDLSDAREGFAMAAAWSDILWEQENRSRLDAPALLWEKIQTYNFGQWGGGLRKALIRRLIELIGNDRGFYVRPDLCLGFLHFSLSEYDLAEDAFRCLLKLHPGDIVLQVRLGNSLSFQKKLSEARRVYAKALLSAPSGIHADAIADIDVRRLVRECGPVMAPVYGWLRDILPLVDLDNGRAGDSEHEKALEVYRTLVLAEAARRKKDHGTVVAQRRNLKQAAPDVFEEYLAMLQRRPLLP